MKYLKLFNNTADFESFKNSDDFITPNVSLIEENNTLFYNPDIEEIIEYHFEFNNMTLDDEHDPFSTAYVETQYGDYSELYNRLESLIEENGDDSNKLFNSDIVLAETNITINGYRVEALTIGDGTIHLVTAGPSKISWDTGAFLTKTSIYYYSPSNEKGPDTPKPEDDMIEYHFEIPMIVTNVGGLKETIGDRGTGLVVPEGTPEAVSEEIERYFSDPHIAEECIDNIRKEKERLSWREFAERLIKFTGEI